MSSASIKLRDLRSRAVPRLSVRGMAAALDLPLGTYSAYESTRYKKPTLPLELTRKIATVLTKYGLDAAEVLQLAGLSDIEALPEAAAIEAAKPDLQIVTMSVVLPSEAALTDMFEGLLAFVPEGASRAEAARILAQRLPTGFAATGSFGPVQGKAPAPEDGAGSQPPTKVHPASSP